MKTLYHAGMATGQKFPAVKTQFCAPQGSNGPSARRIMGAN